MSNAILRGCLSPEISLVNKMPNGTKLQLENKFSYNVKYSKDLTCQGELTFEVFAKEDPEKFHIKTVTVGAFTFKEGSDKDLLHFETFDILFPYVRALIATISVNAGIPAITLPNISIEGQSIYRIGNI